MNTMLKPILLSASVMIPAAAFSQSAVDALSLSRQDIKGTARYMSMGGAFGALGGDLTTLSQNPAGIGVYRSNEVGFTLDLDAQNSKSDMPGFSSSQSRTPFLLNNIGGVLTLKLNSSVVPNLNFGFTYNKEASFNRSWHGSFGALNTSMTNWMAGVAYQNYVTEDEISNAFDPYNPSSGQGAPWITILGYDSYLINPELQADGDTNWYGQWGDPVYDSKGNQVAPGTSGTADFAVTESGGIDSFNIAFGGNFGNVVYWGMDFDITNLNYTRNSYYGENLQNAYVMGSDGIGQVPSQWSLSNSYRVSGQGFAYKLGVIVKPIQELRIGFSFSTPTFYSLTQDFIASTTYAYNGEAQHNPQNDPSLITNDGYPGSYSFRFRSPWKVDVSAAGVIGSNFIISAEYEWAKMTGMKFEDPSYYSYGNDWYTPSSNSYDYDGTNGNIGNYAKNTNTFKVGVEYRVTPQFSVRAGYANISSPVSDNARQGDYDIATANLFPSYNFDESTNYISCGLGYRIKGFYADLAYVYKNNKATYHGFTNDVTSRIQAPSSSVSFTSNQVVLSMGYKF